MTRPGTTETYDVGNAVMERATQVGRDFDRAVEREAVAASIRFERWDDIRGTRPMFCESLDSVIATETISNTDGPIATVRAVVVGRVVEIVVERHR